LENSYSLKKIRIILNVVLCLSISVPQLYAQKSIDSLENAIKSISVDSIKAQTYIELSKQYFDVNRVKSFDYAKHALSLTEEYSNSAIKVSALRNIVRLLAASGDYSQAMRYDQLVLESDLQSKDSIGLAKNYCSIGTHYFGLGEFDEAYIYFTHSYKVANEAKDSIGMLRAIHNVGRVFKELGQYDQALDHLKLAQKMSLNEKNWSGVVNTYKEIGDVLLRIGKYDSALFYLDKALEETKRIPLPQLEAPICVKYAMLYEKQEDYKKALHYYERAFNYYKKINDTHGMSQIGLGMGITLLKGGNFNEAIQKIEASAQRARSLNAKVLEIKCLNQLSILWELKGDYKKSLGYYKQYKESEDSLFSQEMQSKLLRDQIRFETEARDSKIAVLSEQQDLQKSELKKQEFLSNILAVVATLTVILLATVYRSGQRRMKINKLLLQHQEDMDKRTEELERLNQVKDKFFSIISHDLRSPINALAGLLDLIDRGAVKPEEIHLHTSELKVRFNHTRTLLNNLLDWTLLQMDKLNLQPSKVNLYNIVNENISLLNNLQSKKIEILNEVPVDAVGYADANTTNLVIRNLLTNAIKFTNDGGTVTVSALKKDMFWELCVKDNGIGIKPEVLSILFDKTSPYTTRGTANEKGTGLGLILCKEFVEKNGGKIWVESKEDAGSSFWFTLPTPSN
jgi:signal transduction histidine kinase